MENSVEIAYNSHEVKGMAQDFFEYVLNPTWKNLTEEMKQVVLQQVLRYFVNPMLSITGIRPVSYHFGGIKTDTFEVVIDGHEFVFVPGQRATVLGWDSGLVGLSGLDCSEERQELRFSLKRYLNQHVTNFLFTKEKKEDIDFSSDVLTTELVSDAINRHTSPLREVDIPALLVEKKPQIVGMRYLGQYSSVSGQLSGDEVADELLEVIQQLVVPDVTQEVLFQEFPRAIRTETLFIQQNHENPDEFACYMDDAVSYNEIRKEIERSGMGLLNEDEWEYCCGAGCRRLFKWGNSLKRQLLQDEEQSPLWQENMFGLTIAGAEYGPELIENAPFVKGGWIEEVHKAPVLNLLPLSSYYRGLPILELQKKLLPGYFCVRRSIRIEM